MPAVQHARLAARPAGRQHGSSCANTAASARDREPGVADSTPPLQYTTQSHIPSLILSPVLWYIHFGMSLWTAERGNWSYRANTHRNRESAAIVTSRILPSVHKRIFLISALTDNQLFSCFVFLFADNEEELT